jgi:hypothetical protein
VSEEDEEYIAEARQGKVSLSFSVRLSKT